MQKLNGELLPTGTEPSKWFKRSQMYYLVKFYKNQEVYQTLVPTAKLSQAVEIIVDYNNATLYSIERLDNFIELDNYLNSTAKITDNLEFGHKHE